MTHDDDLDARSRTISTHEAAERLGCAASTLDNMRWQGRGPRYVKVGGRVRYRVLDLVEFLDASTRHSTSPASITTNGRTARKEK